MKRGASDALGDREGKGSGKRRGPGDFSLIPGDSGVPKVTLGFKALCTEGLTTLLLGSRGAVKNAIQGETGAKLVFSNKGDLYPSTGFRVLGVYGEDLHSILKALDQVLIRLVELGESEKAKPTRESQDLLGKAPGEFIFRFCLSRQMAGLLIGTGGANIQRLRRDTGAKIFIDDDTLLGHRLVRVIGIPEAIMACLAQVGQMIQGDMSSPEFPYFLRLVNFGEAAASGWDWEEVVGGGPAGPPVPAPAPSRRGPAPGPAPGPVEMPHLDQRTGEGLDRLEEDILAFPPGTADLAYCISCMLPASRVPGLLGKSGEFVRRVEDETGAKVDIDRSPGEHRMMSCTGPLVAVYTAHAMMIQRLEEMAERESRPVEEVPQDPKKLLSTIADLRRQLEEAGRHGGRRH